MGWSRDETHLLKQPSLLYDIWDCLHFDALRLVDVLESVQFPRLLVLDHSDLDTV